LLELLELLQSRPLVTGEEIARQLGIDRRTVRRDVAALQAIGVPVDGVRGVGGGYALRPGFRMPPLMLTADEAVAVALGLDAVRRGRLGNAEAVEAAERKIRRVLPPSLAGRVRALQATVRFTGPDRDGRPPETETSLLLAEAIERGLRLRFGYVAGAGERSQREVSPHGLVVHSARWYLAAFDHGREAERTFRVDRMRHLGLLDGPGDPPADPPDDDDVLARVGRSLARAPWPVQAEVLLDLPVEAAARRIPPTLAEVTSDGDGRTVLVLRAESLDWAVQVIAGLGCGVQVNRPEELRTALRAHGARLAGC
jgi:predicted DNA-binding transcriptional regulator YafY